MKRLDHALASWRIAKASAYVRDQTRVLDIGCYDGALFRHLGPRLGEGVGIDPLAEPRRVGNCRFIQGSFPTDLDGEASFDAIVGLAVLEHVPEPDVKDWVIACRSLVKVGGRVILSVPSPLVDKILEVGIAVHLLDGMSHEEHHGFDPRETVKLFTDAGFVLEAARHFQLGLNHLFVFSRPPE